MSSSDDAQSQFEARLEADLNVVRTFSRNPELLVNEMIALSRIATSRDGASPSELGEENGWDAAQTSRVLKKLRDGDFAVVMQDHQDARVKHYFATLKGRNTVVEHFHLLGYDVTNIKFAYVVPKDTKTAG